jgi:hypothetical protein
MPNCFAALRLAEKGAESPLNVGEKVLLRYHSRLCMHCDCARRKFDRAVEEMQTAEEDRKKGQSKEPSGKSA